MSSIRRITDVRPGYDCVANPCGKRGCGTRPGSSHGRHGDEWIYVVTDGESAMTLTVFSKLLNGQPFPDDSDYWRDFKGSGADLRLHSSFPYGDDEDVDAKGSKCEYLDKGQCFDNGGSALAASNLFKEHGASTLEQSEAFWLAFEAKWKEWRADARPARLYRKCPCCDGGGRVYLDTGAVIDAGALARSIALTLSIPEVEAAAGGEA